MKKIDNFLVWGAVKTAERDETPTLKPDLDNASGGKCKMPRNSLSSQNVDSFFVLKGKIRIPASIAVSLFLLIAWEVIVGFFQIPHWLLPSPSRILGTLYQQRIILLGHTLTTLAETLSGFSLAIIFSIMLALLMDASTFLRKSLYPLIIISQTIPIITIAPLLVIWLGFGMAPKILIVMLICFFPISMNLIHGFSMVDKDYLDLMKTMGATRRQTFFHLKVPFVMPSFFSGLKIAATYSIMGAVIAEWLGAKAGLGEYMRRTLHTFSIERTFAAIVIVVALSLIMVKIIHLAEFIAIPWFRPSRKTNFKKENKK